MSFSFSFLTFICPVSKETHYRIMCESSYLIPICVSEMGLVGEVSEEECRATTFDMIHGGVSQVLLVLVLVFYLLSLVLFFFLTF